MLVVVLADNERLRARVAELEAENERLTDFSCLSGKKSWEGLRAARSSPVADRLNSYIRVIPNSA